MHWGDLDATVINLSNYTSNIAAEWYLDLGGALNGGIGGLLKAVSRL